MSTCHKRKAGRKGSGLGAGSVRCHVTEGVAEERQGGGSGSGRQAGVGSGSGRRAGVGSIRGPLQFPFRLWNNCQSSHSVASFCLGYNFMI